MLQLQQGRKRGRGIEWSLEIEEELIRMTEFLEGVTMEDGFKGKDEFSLNDISEKLKHTTLFDYMSNVCFELASYYSHFYQEETRLRAVEDNEEVKKGLIYARNFIQQFQKQNKGFIITWTNVYALIMGAIIITQKFVEDDHPPNKFYSCKKYDDGRIKIQKQGCGFSLKELNQIEVCMLKHTHYQITEHALFMGPG
jgi:hypothetical protein